MASSPTTQNGARDLDDHPIRVVFADDSAAMRTLARYALSAQRGFNVVAEAANGAEALAMVDTHRPDCIVLDIEMPVMGGFEALAALQERHPNVPVVMLSGFSDNGLAQRAMDAGAAATLDKSSQLKQLSVVLQQVTEARSGAEPAPPARSSATPAVAPGYGGAPRSSDDEARRLEYVIGHDLGEPLRIVSGFVTLLRERHADELDGAGQTFLTHIGDAAERMQAMISALLDYSRAGRMEPTIEPVDLNALVATVYQDLDATLNERAANATAADLPHALADRTMMAEVLRQLVLNAITFNTAATPEVHVFGREEGPSVVITVEDNGIEVNPAQRDRVFDLFQRLNTREEYAGTGTGLAICRRLLKLQHGEIQLDAAPRRGTHVTFTLPKAPNHTGDSS